MPVSRPNTFLLQAPSWALALAWSLTLASTAAAQSDQKDLTDQTDPPPAREAAVQPGAWTLSLSPFTHHWHVDPTHRHVYLAGLERAGPVGSFIGLSLFRNSFGQPSAYAYRGWRWRPWDAHPALYAKLSVGVIYGYLPPYNNKVPLNYHGFSPVVIPALGYQLSDRDAIQVNFLGTAGFMLAYNHTL